MSPYQSNTTLSEIADALREARHVVLTTHAKPDGDALGAMGALGRALELMGKRVERWVMPPVIQSLGVLANGEPVYFHGDDADPLPSDEPDRVVVLDTGAWGQLEPLRKWLEPRRERAIVIDHHLRGDDIGAMRYVDPEAAATCEIIADLIDELGCAYDGAIRDALYVGIATDTGWFRFSNTRPRTHELAARLIRGGVDHAGLYRRLEQAERPEKLALLIRALDSLRIVAGGRAAVMTLRSEDFAGSGARPEETERLIDLPQIVGEVRLAVLITEMPDGRVRLSFRSKPGDDAVDVNQLARQFGGGGHARAAGARTDGPLEDARQRVIAAIEHTLSDVS